MGVLEKEEILSSSLISIHESCHWFDVHSGHGFLQQQIMEGPHLVAHQEFLPAILLGIPSHQHGTLAPRPGRRRKERRSDGSGSRGAQRTKILSSRDCMRYA